MTFVTFYFEVQDAFLVDYQDYHEEKEGEDHEEKTYTSGKCIS